MSRSEPRRSEARPDKSTRRPDATPSTPRPIWRDQTPRSGDTRQGDRDRSADRGRGDQRGRGEYDRDPRNRGDWGRDDERGRQGQFWRRDGSRDRNHDRGWDGRGSREHRRPYWADGRISRIHRYGTGYRIWIAGAPYPFFVPEAYYHRNRWRVGVSIRLGGYYNPLGYYDYYDGRYDPYYDRSRGDLRGVVESVDYRRDTFVVRNEVTGSFVTVVSRDRRDVRPGDYVELSGDWTRSGVFRAYDVDVLDRR